MDAPRVLVVLSCSAGWARGILRGFMAAAHERDWTLLHYAPDADVTWLVEEWKPTAAVIGPEPAAQQAIGQLASAALVSVTTDRTAQGIPSVCLDEDAIGVLAAEHLLGRGLRNLTTFRFDESPFALKRERAFIARARLARVHVAPGWGCEGVRPEERRENPAALLAWLRELPKPCGVLTITDSWARTVVRYARIAGIRIPEDLALVGVDNDGLECELISPSLSSVVVPWREVGQSAAALVHQAIHGKSKEGQRVVISPVSVMERRSSAVLAIDDELVAKAVTWIRSKAEQQMSVSTVVSAIGGGRQRLERSFRRVLGRTIQEEIRRARVELAKQLLETTRAGLNEVAKKSGFSTATLLNLAFQRELSMAPGAYRRRMRLALTDIDE